MRQHAPAGFDEVLQAFGIKDPVSVSLYGNGHINDTYLVITAGEADDLILQRINTDVFKDIPGLMRNVALVTGHLSKTSRIPLRLVPAVSGVNYHSGPGGEAWRMFRFISGTRIYDKVEDLSLAREAGRVIGEFQADLEDLEEELAITIPRFHDIHSRRKEYEQALGSAPAGRLEASAKLRKEYGDRMTGMEGLYDRFRELPVRITHNDPKVNNILFDREGRGICLIDLDTVMPGHVHYDYGDALRTLANRAVEDEPELERVEFDLSLFSAFTGGYLEAASLFLKPDEKELLPFAPLYMTYIIGLRFLSDFLAGDIYYKTRYDEHNLLRSAVQMSLLKDMEMKFDKILLNFT